jgi:DNA polymerase-3 subunit delta'
MSNTIAFPPLPEHAPLWVRIQLALHHQRMAQALLLIGPPHVGLYFFAHRLAAMLLCHAEPKPCGECDSCHLLRAGTHPDCQIIRPEAEGGVIKIDQIRNLQDGIYQSPQCGQRLVIVIEHADKLNIASANALLKVLEEPPSYVHFILGAEQLSSIPATILSRTQRLVFPDLHHDSSNYVALGEHYPAESNRAKLYAKRQSMMISLSDIIEGQLSPCTVAAQWAGFHLADVLWLLYLILAQTMQMQLLHVQNATPDNEAIGRLARLLTPVALLHQFDTIHLIFKKLSHNISINTTLALEQLLTDFIPKAHHDR